MPACASCGADHPVGAKFCIECGTPITAGCPSCGNAVVPGAKFCMECGHRLAQVDATAPTSGAVASRRITSVLFGDLVGFTPLSESRDQEDVRELLSRYFEECSRIVARYGGTVEKFIGDAVMAVWGVPTTNEDDAERSVRAGLELVTAATALGSDAGVPGLAMRVGIVTGEVAVTVGAEMQGMVAGDPVNTASRVQSVAAPGQVWVDETTRLLTSAAISYADVGAHQLKGKTDPVPLWAARAVVATAGGAQRADGLEAPLVGRDRELRVVKEVYHRVAEVRRPALLLVVGDAGVGKTRLGWEFSKYTDGLADTCRWHAGKCVSYGEGVAYYALAEAVRSRLEAARDPEDDRSLDNTILIERGLEEYVTDPAERSWLAPRLGALLGTSGTSGFQREDLFAAWTTFFDRVSSGTEPVVMLIDDAQYADEGLVLFLEHLLASAAFPCFVMLLTRPELATAQPALVTNRRTTLLNLEPLAAADMATLVDGLVEGLPGTVRDGLVERAEGVPTYAVETVRALIDRDLVVPRGGAYVLADPDSLDLAAIGPPASLQALVSARLDRLSSEERRVVDRASVAGASVEPTLLAELCADVVDLDSVLAELVRAQIFTVDHNRLSSEQGRYQFVQSVVRQVAYATLSRRDRKQTHLQVLVALSRDDAPELASVAGQHALWAIEAAPDDDDVPELTVQALALLRQAAARAHQLGAPNEAIGHLGKALELTTEPADRAVLELALAGAHCTAGRYDESIAAARSAQAGFASVDDRHQEALAAAQLAESLTRGPAEYETAAREIEPYYARLSDSLDDLATLARVLDAYNLALNRLGRSDVRLALRQLDAADRLGDQAQIARALVGLSSDQMREGGRLLGLLALEKALAVAQDSHDVVNEAHALANLSSYLSAEDAARALELAHRAVAAATMCGNLEWIGLAEVNLALNRWVLGEWDQMLGEPPQQGTSAQFESCGETLSALVSVARRQDLSQVFDTSVARSGDYWWLLGQAIAQTDAGDHDATDTARAAHDAAHEYNSLGDDYPTVFATVMDIALRNEDSDLLEHLARVVDEAGALPLTALRGHRALLAALTGAQDTPEDAEAHFRTALHEYDAWGSPVYLARAQAAYGSWLSRSGRLTEAEPLLNEARTTYASLGATAWLAELEEALSGNRVGS